MGLYFIHLAPVKKGIPSRLVDSECVRIVIASFSSDVHDGKYSATADCLLGWEEELFKLPQLGAANAVTSFFDTLFRNESSLIGPRCRNFPSPKAFFQFLRRA